MSRHLTLSTLLVIALVPGALQAQHMQGAQSSEVHFSSLARDHWQLNENEIERLELLVNIERAFTDVDNLTPFEILGKYAESELERRRYADRYTEAMADHQRRSFRWAVMVATSAKEREAQAQAELQNDPVLRGYLSSLRHGAASTDPGPARWHLHVPVECADCQSIVNAAVEQLDSGGIEGLDVIFIGMEDVDESAVRNWIDSAGLSIEDIQSDRITVNLDEDEWLQERLGQDEPMIVHGTTGALIEN